MADYPDYTTLMQIIGSDIMIPIDLQASYIQMPIDIQGQYVQLRVNIEEITDGVTFNIGSITGTVNINIESVAGDVVLNANITNASIAVTGTVAISGTPTVNISGEVDVNITNASIAITGTVTISGTPTVNISGEVNVNITNASIAVTGSVSATVTGSVSISGTPTVNISGTVTVNVSGTAQIDIETQSVGIYLQPEWAAKTGIDKTIRVTGPDIGIGESTFTDYVVTTGKTLYVSSFTGSSSGDVAEDRDKMQIVTGHLANLTDSLYFGYCGGNGGFSVSFVTPVAIPSGKKLRIRIENRAGHVSNVYAAISSYEV